MIAARHTQRHRVYVIPATKMTTPIWAAWANNAPTATTPWHGEMPSTIMIRPTFPWKENTRRFRATFATPMSVMSIHQVGVSRAIALMTFTKAGVAASVSPATRHRHGISQDLTMPRTPISHFGVDTEKLNATTAIMNLSKRKSRTRIVMPATRMTITTMGGTAGNARPAMILRTGRTRNSIMTIEQNSLYWARTQRLRVGCATAATPTTINWSPPASPAIKQMMCTKAKKALPANVVTTSRGGW